MPVDEPWWITKRKALLTLAEQHLNAYVYDLTSVRTAAGHLKALGSVSRILYAVKANFNEEVIRTLSACNVDFDCVSPGEVMRLREVLGREVEGRNLFTPNFAPKDEYVWGIREGLQVTLDNLFPLKQWPNVFKGQDLFVRMDPDHGAGHHSQVVTAGAGSKFGVSLDEVDELVQLVGAAGARVVGIHAHSGSGILDPENWRSVANTLREVASRFPHVRVLDLGGGIGVPERSTGSSFDLGALDRQLGEVRHEYPDYELWLEPGRYLVSVAGILLTHVTQIKQKGKHGYVGVSTGFNALIRPALYDSYHEIVNLSKIEWNATEKFTIVGPICETGDTFGTGHMLPVCEENDVILIANAGAYGHVMSSRYNLRDIPPEISI
ncbi:MAG: hypothetical protein VX236_04230 [Pseudomonadota bacterium]|nr:hypothetical protein [Pseudomonadota bacterium]